MSSPVLGNLLEPMMSNDETRETKPDQKAVPKSDAIPDLTARERRPFFYSPSACFPDRSA